MERNEDLHQLPAFQEQKDATLGDYPEYTFDFYCFQMRKCRVLWADGLVLLCTSLMLGREIVLVTHDKGKAKWYVGAKANIDWPYTYMTPPLTLSYLHMSFL